MDLAQLVDAKIAAYQKGGQSGPAFRKGNDKALDIPDGVYRTIVDGRFRIAPSGNAGYQLNHTIAEGEFKGRTVR